ncbi:13297_t:CDS:1, partial [Dentiscutata heterogama]
IIPFLTLCLTAFMIFLTTLQSILNLFIKSDKVEDEKGSSEEKKDETESKEEGKDGKKSDNIEEGSNDNDKV